MLKVYSDQSAVALFNSDNCDDDFYYTTEERMEQAIDFWLYAYQVRGFVRFSIVDKESDEVIGTIENFHRDSEDYFTNCGLIRLDLRSDYEVAEEIVAILGMVLEPAFDLFSCGCLATKAIPQAKERIFALEELGFVASNEKIIGHDGTEFGHYFVLEKSR